MAMRLIDLRLPLLLVTLLASACSAAKPAADAPPHAVLTLEPGLSFDAKLDYTATCFAGYGVTFEDHLAAQTDLLVAVSPSGRYRVRLASGPNIGHGGRGLVIEDLQKKSVEFWDGVQPVMWDSATDRLIVRDAKMGLYSTTGPGGAMEPLALSADIKGRLVFGANGYLFYMASDRRVTAVGLEGQAQVFVLDDPVADLGVTCDARATCTPFVETEARLTRLDDIPRRTLHAGSDGAITRYTIKGTELDFVHVDPAAKTATAIARTAGARGVFTVTADGGMTAVANEETGRDVMTAVIDQQGKLAAVKPFVPNPTSETRPVRLRHVTTQGMRVYEELEAGKPARIIVSDRNGHEIARSGTGCAANPVVFGSQVESPVGQAQAWYFAPSGARPPKALVAYYHGGYYRAFSGTADFFTSTLTNSGYGVVTINRVGTPGYGADGFAIGPNALSEASLQSARLLRQVASREKLAPGTKWYSIGVSAGTQPAVANLALHPADWAGGLLVATTCNRSGRADATEAAAWRTPSYMTVIDPASRDSLKICELVIASDRTIAVHGRDDTQSPLDSADAFFKRSGIAVSVLDGTGHDLSVAQIKSAVEAADARWSAPLIASAGTTSASSH